MFDRENLGKQKLLTTLTRVPSISVPIPTKMLAWIVCRCGSRVSKVRNRVFLLCMPTNISAEVVEDAKQGFESSTFIDPPALPIGPVSRSIPQNPAGRPRRPRRIPQASEIFADPGFSNDKTIESTPKNPVNMIALSTASRRHTLTIPEIRTPSKQRRATLQPTSSNSMTAGKQGSLSSRKGKSQSQDFVINRPIAPMELLEATLDERR